MTIGRFLASAVWVGFILLTLSLIFGCTQAPLTPAPVPTERSEYPATGWLPEYDALVRSLVTEVMLTQPNSRMQKFCSNWGSLTMDQRREMYVDLMYAITKPESNYKRASMYWEESQGKDSVTGLTTKTSEGFLQLSYSDKSYGPACDFDYAHDKPFHEKDIASKPSGHSWNSAYPNDKNILHPLKNLKCGVAIFNKLLSSKPEVEFADRLGAYWATMRRLDKDGNPKDAYKSIWTQLRSRGTPCK